MRAVTGAWRPRAPGWVLAGLSLLGSGCSVLSPEPVWELVKATGSVASLAIQSAPGKASHTVYHLHARPQAVCIEFNPAVPVPDVVPALQAELRAHQVESRVYEAPGPSGRCPVWLRYAAAIDWGVPPFGKQHQPYLHSAALSLQDAQGQVLSTSQYAVDSALGTGKWASTRDKLSPVVTALLTGFEN